MLIKGPMSQLIHALVVKLWESEGSKVVYKVMMVVHLHAIVQVKSKVSKTDI